MIHTTLSQDDRKKYQNRLKRIAESEKNARKYGHRFLLMQLSALSPTTRKSHADRHGKLFTPDQVRAWLSSGDNSIGCKCSFTEVLVDDKGQPLLPSLVDRARATYEKLQARGYDWSKD